MKVTIHQAKTTLSRLIRRAEAGEDVLISRGDVPVARLLAVTARTPGRRPGTLRGKVKVTRAFFEPLPADELTAWEGRK